MTRDTGIGVPIWPGIQGDVSSRKTNTHYNLNLHIYKLLMGKFLYYKSIVQYSIFAAIVNETHSILSTKETMICYIVTKTFNLNKKILSL